MNIQPCYGRDYTSKKALLEDLNANKDFIINDMFHKDDGRYCNKTDLEGQTVQIRYNKLRKVAVYTISGGKAHG